MSDILGSELFREFYNAVSLEPCEPSEYMTNYLEGTNRGLSIVSDKMHIGCLELFINAPSNAIEIDGTQERYTLFELKGNYDSTQGLRDTFVTSDFGIIQLVVYPKADYTWTDDDEKDLEFLFKVLFDATLKIRLAILLKQAAITDPVTGSCNSVGITNYVGKLHAQKKLGAYNSIFFNIKNFSYVNQKIGSREGDNILKSYSFMIREFIEKGELFGRFGGDNFFLLVEKERTEDVIKYITTRRVLANTEEKPIEFDIMIRAGIYDILPGDNPQKVISSAKAASEFARKPSYGDIVNFTDNMLEKVTVIQEISNSFKQALQRKEFIVYYQPKVDLQTSKLISAEALCRWVRNGEIVPPMEFIPTLEKEGSIPSLDFYMLSTVCDHINDWLGRGIEPVRISVNFSRANILNKKLADKILKVIRNHKVDPKYIEVEITEMSGYEDFESLSEFVNFMKENGIETSIDDFGTGYSSLNLIKDLNVDTIKLDKAFLEEIKNEGENLQNRSVVKNIISMVNELDMKVVAEGVETDAQREFLKQVNCQVAQGFLFDKPMPKEKFEFRLIGERLY
ncbi:MAG: bifunctional diguanylate cyclase/phosphodiesterase [Lachnospiraceae bacterium]|nr:bifunctional diguanylate cyclase/phosphodiesterase [Lachnospiraceae bacterium]